MLTLNANYKWQPCLLESSFGFNMNMKILVILKEPFLILTIILDLMLVLALVNYFGNLSWWQNRLYYFLKTDLFWSIDTVILFHKTATILQPDIFFWWHNWRIFFTSRVPKNTKEKIVEQKNAELMLANLPWSSKFFKSQ